MEKRENEQAEILTEGNSSECVFEKMGFSSVSIAVYKA